ncbi:MAG: flagellar hook-length control protein FliK [Magnetococcus sp. YQC-5]
MIITGTLITPIETPSLAPDASPPPLMEGKILVGRITQAGSDGYGMVRLSNGSQFSFSGGVHLQVGEQVTLEVTRLLPEVTLRLVASESGVAANLAQSVEQSLRQAPDLLDKMMHLAGLTSAGKGGKDLPTLLVGGRMAGVLGRSETLTGLLQKVLPNVSGEGILKGDLTSLVRLLETGSRQEVVNAVNQLRQAAATLHVDTPGVSREDSAVLTMARNTLQQVGDLISLQHVLPQLASPTDGSLLLGYRFFWLTDGGLGEAIWKRERQKKQGGKAGADSVISVLLSLNMTRLGQVQARLAYGDEMLQVGLAARDDEALTLLRQNIAELRQNLLAAHVPLRTLDLSKLGEMEMNAERLAALGVGAGCDAEA